MPKLPTGNPRGRPKGTGKLTPAQTVEEAQKRVTVRLPTVLYMHLEIFAAGRSVHRGSSQRAQCIREALEEYLDRHTKRQTENGAQGPTVVSQTAKGKNRQTSNVPAAQSSIDPEPDDRDSVEWRRWAVLEQVRTAQEARTPGDIARQLGCKSGDIRNDLEFWRKQGKVHHEEQGGYAYSSKS